MFLKKIPVLAKKIPASDDFDFKAYIIHTNKSDKQQLFK
jgi:hypothetical protein